MLSVMTGAGPMTIRESARRLDRDVKAVYGDVHALLNAGILQKTKGWHSVFFFRCPACGFHAERGGMSLGPGEI